MAENNTNLYSSSSKCQRSGSYRATGEVLEGWFPQEAPEEKVFLVFCSFESLPQLLGLWPHQANLCFCYHLAFPYADHPPPSYQDSCEYIRPIQMMQNNLSISRS